MPVYDKYRVKNGQIFIFNSFTVKNLCNLARHKCKTPWRWHWNVETCSSIYYAM